MLCSFPHLPQQCSPAVTVLGPAGAAPLPRTDKCWGMLGHKCVCQCQGKKSVQLFAASSIFPQDGGDISSGAGGLLCPAGMCHKHRDRCVTYRCVTHCCLGRWEWNFLSVCVCIYMVQRPCYDGQFVFPLTFWRLGYNLCLNTLFSGVPLCCVVQSFQHNKGQRWNPKREGRSDRLSRMWFHTIEHG